MKGLAVILSMAAVLAACGSSGGSDTDSSRTIENPPATGGPMVVDHTGKQAAPKEFISWTGNASGEGIRDANNNLYRILRSPACVYSELRDIWFSNWCNDKNDPWGPMRFGDLTVKVFAHRLETGECVAVFLDTQSLRMVYLYHLYFSQYEVRLLDRTAVPC
jgi:hypothetical protein